MSDREEPVVLADVSVLSSGYGNARSLSVSRPTLGVSASSEIWKDDGHPFVGLKFLVNLAASRTLSPGGDICELWLTETEAWKLMDAVAEMLIIKNRHRAVARGGI